MTMKYIQTAFEQLHYLRVSHVADGYVMTSGMVAAIFVHGGTVDMLLSWPHWFSLNFFVATLIGLIRLFQISGVTRAFLYYLNLIRRRLL